MRTKYLNISFKAIEVRKYLFSDPQYYAINDHGERYSITKEKYEELEKIMNEFEKIKPNIEEDLE